MALQESVHVFGQPTTNALRRSNLFNGRFPKATHGSKSPQQQIFPVLAYTGAIIENAFFDAFFHEQLMIRIGEPMGLVTNALKQTQRRRIHWQPQRQCPGGPINLLAFLGQAYDRKIVQA